MTKEELEQFKARTIGSDITYVAHEVADALESAWVERDEAVKEGRRLTSLLEQAETGRESYKAEVVTLKAKIAELQEFGL